MHGERIVRISNVCRRSKKGNSMALDMLKVHVLLKSISDDKFGHIFTSVSTDLTVALIDQRLRNEILKGDKYDNQHNN